MNQDILSKDFINGYKNKIPPFGFNGMGYFVYKRTYSRLKADGNSEEWYETVSRCINGAQRIGAEYTEKEAQRLFDHIFNLRCNFAGRMLWQLGTPTVEKFGANSLLNCWNVSINSPRAFLFLFENLMLGGGVGFSIRREDVHELPRIKKGVKIEHQETKDADFIVPDSRAGWVKLLETLLDAFYVTGKSFTYSTILVRGAGEPIKGFGGTASGPTILVEGIQKICKIFADREEKKLRSLDALDICNIIGSIVVAGNVRRSALIALGDPDDYLYLRAKNWSLGNVPNWRAMSNNTIYADAFDHISNEIWENGYMIDQKTGYARGEPYGFFNLPLSQKYGRLKDGPMKDSKLYPVDRDNVSGTNPCAEISLASYECCVGYETPIITKEGITTIGSAAISKSKIEIWNGEKWSLVEPHLTRKNQKMLRVYFGDGSYLDTTEDHRFSIADRFSVSRGYKEIMAKDLKPYDKYAIHTEPFKIEYNHGQNMFEDSMYTLGFAVGDGHVDQKNTYIVLYGIKDFKCPIKGTRNDVKQLARYNVPSQMVNVSDHVNYHYVSELKSSHEAFDFIFTLNRKSILNFVAGLADSDGCNASNGIRIYISDYKRAQKVQLLLTKCGIRSSVNLCQLKGTKTNLSTRTRDLYYLQITNCKDIPCYRLDTTKGKDAIYKGKWQVIEKIETLEGLHDAYCFNEPLRHMAVFNNSLTYQCNLSELYLNNVRSVEELTDCAKLLYKTQKAISAMPFLHEETNAIVHKNMRLGLGVTGVCQSLHKMEWLDECYVELRKFDKEWSKKRGWPESIKLTTVKPSGTLSLLGGATPGVHPAYSEYYIRRVRIGSNDKLVDVCRKHGYPVEYVKNFDNSENRNTVVVEFPCQTPKGAVLAKDVTVVKQLDMVAQLQNVWSDNAVSVTAYYTHDEIDALKGWLKDNYEKSIKSVSFLLRDKHGFQQAPYEEITKERYEDMVAKIKPLVSFDEDFGNGVLGELECAGGACPIR